MEAKVPVIEFSGSKAGILRSVDLFLEQVTDYPLAIVRGSEGNVNPETFAVGNLTSSKFTIASGEFKRA